MITKNWQQHSYIVWWVVFQAWLAGIASALIMYVVWQGREGVSLLTIITGATISGLASLLISWPMIRVLALMARSLSHLARNHQLAALPTLRYWPFHRLIAHINTLGGHGRDIDQLRGAFVEQIRDAAAQEERNRLARDLHDSIKQQIFSMNLNAATAQARFSSDPDGALKALDHLQSRATEAMDEMDALLHQLRPAPLEQVGLTEAIREQCTFLGYRTGARVHCDIGELPPNEQFEIGTQTHIYRIVQEALSNIARHARATRVIVSLRSRVQDKHIALALTIQDNGQGFETTSVKQGMGLRHIHERAHQLGTHLKLQSGPQGTILRVEDIPLLPEAVSTQVVAPAAVRDHVSLQQYRHRRFYILLAIVFFLINSVWPFATDFFAWLPPVSWGSQNVLFFGIVLILWHLFHLGESRQLLALIKLDALADFDSQQQLQIYVFGQQTLILALSGYFLTGMTYWIGRSMPTPWLYERTIALIMVITAVFFACFAVYQQIKRDRTHIHRMSQAAVADYRTFIKDKEHQTLFMLAFASLNAFLWAAIIFTPDTDLTWLFRGIVYWFQIIVQIGVPLLFFYAIVSILALLRKRKLRAWLRANLMASGDTSLRLSPYTLRFYLVTGLTFLFWQSVAGPKRPIAFWFDMVTIISLSSIWAVCIIRLIILSRTHNEAGQAKKQESVNV